MSCPDSAQEVFLQTIAPLCPFQYGYGVYLARALLSSVDTTIYTNSCEMIDTGSGGHKSITRKNNSVDSALAVSLFNVYPNPNNGGFTVSYQLQQGETGEFVIYNMLGEKLADYNLDANNTIMSINQTVLNNGVYLYEIRVNNGVVKQNRLVIIK